MLTLGSTEFDARFVSLDSARHAELIQTQSLLT